jgi:L-amino acid N-acyltransferase YncA
MNDINIIELNSENLSRYGCFCLKSKPGSEGYRNKNIWMKKRLAEGLKYLILSKDNKTSCGFIEYIPSEYAWRGMQAENYLVIHCLWTTSSGLGYGSRLIQKSIEDAKAQNKYGVAVVTNSKETWIVNKDIFIKNGFKLVGETLGSFELLVYKFGEYSDPYFPDDWDSRARKLGNGLTILRSYQCPYVEVATNNILEGAEGAGIKPVIIDLKDRDEMMNLTPSPYGVFNVVYKGKLVAFHRLTVRAAKKLFQD